MQKEAKGVWALTREHNSYDQFGTYAVAVFACKPTLQQLADFFSSGKATHDQSSVMGAVAFLEHLRNGGGRQGTEDVWYNLDFVKFGDLFPGAEDH